ncbi:hypothetical protein ACJMK2_022344, partial [Sinanodonta woodiana]
DGDFNKVYDRKMVKKSMVNFLLDPTGDIPWEEEAGAENVVHVDSEQSFNKLLKREKNPVLAMFYAPWCGFCKKLKPDFAAAATEMKGKAALVGLDVEKPHLMNLRAEYNITGFPTLYYFKEGRVQYRYGGENNKDGIVNWLNDPKPPEEPKKEKEWADDETDVVHLHDDDFDDFINTHNSVMVMFYAPWCGHCKSMKPEYEAAAAAIKAGNIDAVLAAVDATKEKRLGTEYKIQGFPTVKYFKDGAFAWDFNERTADKFLEHMKNPTEPPPPPPTEAKWEEVESDVVHLTDENFKNILKKKKHALVMFYAPWCGHCKKAKPEYMQAAAKYKDDNKVVFAAIDCTTHNTMCTSHDVTGYPTFKYFNYGKNEQKYMGGREEQDFVNFMKDPLNPVVTPAPTPASPPPQEQWADIEGQENLHHLTSDTFDAFIKGHNSVLVMFYAPWCGHCKHMKPAYGEAAAKLAAEGFNGVLATVDATAEQTLGSKYSIRGYPTSKYRILKNGEFAYDYESGREANDFVAFMKDPKAPTPPPPPEPAWSTVKSNVKHLNGKNFTTFLTTQDAALVMFYAPWCGHCKKAKPQYQSAADKLLDDKRSFAAVDCTAEENKEICSKEEVKGFPTFRLYIKGNFLSVYNGDRTEVELLKFIQNAPTPKDEL